MKKVLYIAEPVLTGDLLRRLHQGQQELCCVPGTVITPTGWDYIRQFRLQVTRGSAPSAASAPQPPVSGPPSTPPSGSAQELIREVPPQLVAVGRCDQPDQPYGCRTDEFGSGFAAPAPKKPSDVAAPAEPSEVEALVQQITDLVIAELTRE